MKKTMVLLFLIFLLINDKVEGKNLQGKSEKPQAGTEWFSQTTGTINNLYAVYFYDANNGWAVGRRGTIIRTTDGGVTWKTQTSNKTNDLYSVFFTSLGNGIVTGRSINGEAAILRTTNGGSTWYDISYQTPDYLYCVYFINPTIGWMVGGRYNGSEGIVMKSTDGGITWIQQRTYAYTLYSIIFINSNIGWFSGYNGTVLKTIDGGKNWSEQGCGTPFNIPKVTFANTQIGWLIGYEGNNVSFLLKKTTDGGKNWNDLPLEEDFAVEDVFFVDENNGWLVGDGIRRSTDGGASWTPQLSDLNRYLYASHFVDRFNGWAVGASGTVLKYQPVILYPPAITTDEVTSIDYFSAVCGGNVTSDGGDSVIARGVVWSVSPNPTIDLQTVTSDGSSTGTFISQISGLEHNTEYYVRAYATNSMGTSYGEERNFTTLNLFPTVTTKKPSSITKSSAESGGEVLTEGAAEVTAHGIIWSKSPNPTIELDTKTLEGTGSGTFTSIITDLEPRTNYYVVAYASNTFGVGYGNQEYFTTLSDAPTVTTDEITSITETGAQSGGEVTSEGGLHVTARGVVWSELQNPTIDLSTKTKNGTGWGVFISSISGLQSNSKYYVRAYATNPDGTSYGEELFFTTLISDVESSENHYDLRAFVNPVSEQLIVSGAVSKPGMTKISIYSYRAEDIFSINKYYNERIDEGIDISSYPMGVYFVVVENDSGRKIFPVLIK